MSTFDELRQQARDKRDRAIKYIKKDYSATLEQINALEKKLVRRKPSLKGRAKPAVPLRVEILDCAPRDSTFTVQDILDRLELPETEFTRVRTTFDRMIKRCEIKRIKRGRRNIPAVFAVYEYGPPTNELNDLSQIEAAELVLRRMGRPVELTTLAVEMLERGYEPVNGRQSFIKSLRQAMSRKELFVHESNKWFIANDLLGK